MFGIGMNEILVILAVPVAVLIIKKLGRPRNVSNLKKTKNKPMEVKVGKSSLDYGKENRILNTSQYSKVVFERHGDPGWLPLGIFTVNPDGSDCMQIRSTQTGGAPEWSPDGKWIAFHDTPEGYEFHASNIFIMRPDGGAIKQLTFHGDGAAACPTWSPDSKRIVYCLWKDQAHQIWVVDIEDSRAKQITHEGSNGYPVWAPSNEIIFHREDISPAKLFIMDQDGNNQKECNLFQTGDQEPVWSRDGSKIVFIRDGGICVVSADGANLNEIPGASHVVEVSWSPDGQTIVYTCAGLSSGQEVYVVDLKGDNHVKIVENPPGANDKGGGICDVCWSPWLLGQENASKIQMSLKSLGALYDTENPPPDCVLKEPVGPHIPNINEYKSIVQALWFDSGPAENPTARSYVFYFFKGGIDEQRRPDEILTFKVRFDNPFKIHIIDKYLGGMAFGAINAPALAHRNLWRPGLMSQEGKEEVTLDILKKSKT